MARQVDPSEMSVEEERDEMHATLNRVSDQLAIEIRTLAVLEDALNSLSRRVEGRTSKSVQGVEEVLYRHQERLVDLYERVNE